MAVGSGQSIPVRVWILNSFLAKHPEIDDMKLDVEGPEMPLLEGLPESARRRMGFQEGQAHLPASTSLGSSGPPVLSPQRSPTVARSAQGWQNQGIRREDESRYRRAEDFGGIKTHGGALPSCRLGQFQAVQELRTSKLEEALQEHRLETQQAVQELKQITQANHCRLEKNMAEQFANMLTELSKPTRQDAKRPPAPSPKGQPSEAIKAI